MSISKVCDAVEISFPFAYWILGPESGGEESPGRTRANELPRLLGPTASPGSPLPPYTTSESRQGS